MPLIPTLVTPRLLLRAFTFADAPAVENLAGAREVASTTLCIPHPYPQGAAETWIRTHAARFDQQTGIVFAIEEQSTKQLCGAIGLDEVKMEHHRAELGYWIGVPYWGRGYCTEAARAVVRFGFQDWSLHRIYAGHYVRNPASGRVLQKIGMRYEGRLRQHICKWGSYDDLEQYGLLRREWELAQSDFPEWD